jgi:hypothetical protein
MSLMWDSIEDKPVTNVPVVFQMQQIFKIFAKFNVIIWLYIMLYYLLIYLFQCWNW